MSANKAAVPFNPERFYRSVDKLKINKDGTVGHLVAVAAVESAYQAGCSARDDLVKALKLCAAVCAGETTSKRGLIEALEAAQAALSSASAA